MKRNVSVSALIFTLAAALVAYVVGFSRTAATAPTSEIEEQAVSALKALTAKVPAAKELAKRAVAVLVFPGVYKAGLMVGAQKGEGVLLKNGRPDGHYRTTGASFGLQAGAQKYGYALMFMTKEALDYLEKSDGWEIGMGPSVVVVDEGMGKSLTSTTATKEVYAFIFNQEGLMAGLGLQGNKITKTD